MNIFGAFWTIAGGIAWAVVFGVMAPKHDAKFIFTLFVNNSGYTSKGWVFIMSFYSPMYGLYGTDGMMHLVEEMKDASKEAPRVMVWSMIFCSVTSWLAALLLLWTAGNWEDYMAGKTTHTRTRTCSVFQVFCLSLANPASRCGSIAAIYELVDGRDGLGNRWWGLLCAGHDGLELLHHRRDK